MTSGNITRQIFFFSLPIVLGNIFQQLYNTADAVIVGQLIGKNAFASVSVANPIMSVVLFFLVGLSMGVGVLLAQKYGAKDMIITSVPKDDCKKGIVLYEDRAFLYIGNAEEMGEYHGAGDAFDGMFLSKQLQGYTLLESVQASHAFVCECISESERYEYPEREGLLIEKTLRKLV